MAAILLERLTKHYPGGVVACDQLDLEVQDGELLALLGPSGSGKSTLLRLVAGLERPTDGTVRIGTRVVNDVPARHRDVAMVFQSHALYPHWTVYKNLAFGLGLRRFGAWLRELRRDIAGRQGPDRSPLGRDDIHDRVLQTAAKLGIGSLLDRKPGELSGGEGQRVALGRAMIRRPTVFLFDEPLSNLDAPLRTELRRQIKQLHVELGTTMIYVTHDQSEALALGDRVAVIHEGKIEQVGGPHDLYDRPANRFVAGFVGSTPMNFFDARPGGEGADGVRFCLSSGDWSIDVEGRWWRGTDSSGRCLVGLRPEDIHLFNAAVPHPSSLIPDPATVAACVEMVEHQGDSRLISISPRSPAKQPKPASPNWTGAVLCRCRDCSELKPGEQVIALFDMRRAHWFDGQSGRNLCLPGAR